MRVTLLWIALLGWGVELPPVYADCQGLMNCPETFIQLDLGHDLASVFASYSEESSAEVHFIERQLREGLNQCGMDSGSFPLSLVQIRILLEAVLSYPDEERASVFEKVSNTYFSSPGQFSVYSFLEEFCTREECIQKIKPFLEDEALMKTPGVVEPSILIALSAGCALYNQRYPGSVTGRCIQEGLRSLEQSLSGTPNQRPSLARLFPHLCEKQYGDSATECIEALVQSYTQVVETSTPSRRALSELLFIQKAQKSCRQNNRWSSQQRFRCMKREFQKGAEL